MASSGMGIDDYCRLCAVKSQSGVIIYSAEGEDLCLEEKIISCLRIELSRDDMLPKRVCQSCNHLLEDYYRFLERAAQVQQTLYYLLGFHLSHSQEEESTNLCLMEDGVKIESNIIKKELDDFVAHQRNIHVERKGFDFIVPQNETNFEVGDKLDCAVNIEIGGEEILINETKDETSIQLNQKRKKHSPLLLPKKDITTRDIELEEIDCFIEEVDTSKELLKTNEFRNDNLFEENLFGDNYEAQFVSIEDEASEEDRKLEEEWKKHWGIICDQCKVVFGDKFQFERHYRFFHHKKAVLTCSFCKKILENHMSYKPHIFEHINSGRFKCKFCSKKFFVKELLQIHLSLVHNEENMCVCEECGKSFTSHLRFEFHLKNHEKSKIQEFQCTECGKTLQTKGGLAAHKSVHRLGKHFMCHICGKTFTQKINMQQHVKHHIGDRPHSCEICKKSFPEKSHLNRHKSFHSQDRPFRCLVCNKTYKTERCLKVHNQIHKNSRPYVCSYCGKGFLSSTKLKQHYNCHTGERPYACKYCERTFTNYPNWLKHTRRRHKVDPKTGVNLKNEDDGRWSLIRDPFPLQDNSKISQLMIEFVEVPDVEVKGQGQETIESQNSSLEPSDKNLKSGRRGTTWSSNVLPSRTILLEQIPNDERNV